MDIPVPEYIDERLIAKSLANGLGVRKARILESTITRATANGDNYMSDVFRIVACYIDEDESEQTPERRHVSMVVKSLPETGQRGPIIKQLLAYEKEATMFRDIVPQLSKMTDDTFFAARCYYASDLPERLIVFEDLKALGYVTANRHAGLDFEHCALVMKKIGQFHAASMQFAVRELELLNGQFHFSLFNPDHPEPMEQMRCIFEKGLETLIVVAKTQWDDFDQTIVDKMEKLMPVYMEKLRECLEQDCESDGGYRVLNHGDLWSNNMMFRHDRNDPSIVQDVAFVDLQISFYSSPGLDLNYVLATCPNYETRTRLDELIEVYYGSFRATLERLEYNARPIPTLDDVRREIRRMEFYALMSIVSVLPIVLMDQTDELVANFENLMEGADAE